jgi:tRNA(Ile)-lysidine synthase
MIKKDDLIILGLSGGPDSMCLFHLLLAYKEIVPFSLCAVHVNHMLRKEANEEAIFVQDECDKFDVPCHVITIDVAALAKKEKISTEEAGRMARYQAFEQILQIEAGLTDVDEKKVSDPSKGKIAIAHNKNDVAETVLFNLFRGTGMQGLGGIDPINGNIIRPILCLKREEIERYLKENDISFCTDLSNVEDIYTRNRIRKHILPYAEKEINDQAINHIAETTETLRDAQDFIMSAVGEAKKQTIIERKHKIFIKKEEFELLHVTIKNELLRSVLFELSGKQKDITRIHISDLRNLFDKQVGKEISLPYQMLARRAYDGIILGEKEEGAEVYVPKKLEMGKQMDPILGEVSVEIIDKRNLTEIPEKTCTKWFDYDKIKRYLFLRTRKSGDYIVINKEGNKKKIKEYMINQKIPKEERDKMVLLADGDHIVWIPGYRISETYKVTEETKRVIKIHIKDTSD